MNTPDTSPVPPEKRNIFTLAYRFYQKYRVAEDTPEFWNAVHRDMEIAFLECRKQPLAKDILLACFGEFEREAKAKSK